MLGDLPMTFFEVARQGSITMAVITGTLAGVPAA
jgi:hypothetical protein